MKRSIEKLSLGGFCAENGGIIRESYSISGMPKTKIKGGFCFKNSGKISDCFSRNLRKKKKSYKFFYENSGSIVNAFVDNSGDKDPKKAETDADAGVTFCNFNETKISDLKDKHDIDVNDFWVEHEDEDNLLNLELKNKFYEVSQVAEVENIQPIIISSAQELSDISAKINGGDQEAATAYYVLKNDIDLKGKKWEPLGNIKYPFRGIFDGNGHKIFNFSVVKKNVTFAGFFGIIEDAVVLNLQVDCVVKAGSYAGGFVGMNKHGKIYSCSAIAQVMGKNYAGGFVGHNTGVIEGCYFYGRIKKFFPIAFLLFALPIIALITLLVLYIWNPFGNKSTFNNIPVDPYSSKMSDEIYSGGGNKASFRFSDVIKYSNGEADFDFGNADTTNQSMTIKIQITDQELKNKIGRTGRTKAEQQDFDNNPNYDPSNTRVTISESGLVLPGYELKKLILKQLPDGTTLPNGTYNGIAYLSFFNHETNEKAIINSQVPLAIVIDN